MRRLFSIVLLLQFSFFSMVASPVFRTKKTVVQPDGTSLTVIRTGADNLCYYVTTDGIPVFPKDNGVYYYAEFNENRDVVATDVVAHEQDKRNPIEERYAKEIADNFAMEINMRNMTKYNVGSVDVASVKCVGDVKIAVILAEFKDLSFKEENDISRFDKHFNASEYYDEGGGGSVRDYFIAQSDSLFRPSFDILAKVKVSKNASYYGSNVGGSDKAAKSYIIEAFDSACAKGVDFSPYINEENELFVVVIYPGHGEQVSGVSSQLWAAYYYALSYNNGPYKLRTGLVMDELANYGQGEMFDGIGTFCHEFSHAIGLPDFYNTTSASNIFGMDVWSIMDYGQFNNFSHSPVGYTSYEREFMGWLKVDTLANEKQLVSLPPLHTNNKGRALRIPNLKDKTGNEYYLLENRQKSPWYMKVYGEGMLVLHIDYNSTTWLSNTVNNNASHQRMTIIPADNVLTKISSSSIDYKGDFFPGYLNVKEFDNTTSPAAVAYVGGYMDIKMRDIHVDENKNVIFYYQCEGQLDCPKNLKAEKKDNESVLISFNAIENAEKYIVDIYNKEILISSDTTINTSLVLHGLELENDYNIFVTATSDDYLNSTSAEILYVFSEYLKQDVNKDGEINSADVVAVYNFISGTVIGQDKIHFDLNEDGVVDSADITALFNHIINSKN